ncbi:hypothetical protein Tco_0470217, partial [Tanacetum coccineum]
IHVHETQEPPVATQSVSDPDPLSYLENWTALRFFIIQIAVTFPNWHPSIAYGTICSSVRMGDAITGACSALAIDSVIRRGFHTRV